VNGTVGLDGRDDRPEGDSKSTYLVWRAF
jgi:hypothetical protein